MKYAPTLAEARGNVQAPKLLNSQTPKLLITMSFRFKTIVLMLLLLLPLANAQAQKSKKTTLSDREYWVSLAVKMATPVLENMSRGELQKTMQTCKNNQ